MQNIVHEYAYFIYRRKYCRVNGNFNRIKKNRFSFLASKGTFARQSVNIHYKTNGRNELVIFQQRYRKIKDGRHCRRNILYYPFIHRDAFKIFCRGSTSGFVYRMGSWAAFYAFHPGADNGANKPGMEI